MLKVPKNLDFPSVHIDETMSKPVPHWDQWDQNMLFKSVTVRLFSGASFLMPLPHFPALWDSEKMFWVTGFFAIKVKGCPLLFSTDMESGSWFLSYNINTRELHATKQPPSRYPFWNLSLKIQRCPGSCPRCIFKNTFPFFLVCAGALLVAFLICFLFTPWLWAIYPQSCL